MLNLSYICLNFKLTSNSHRSHQILSHALSLLGSLKIIQAYTGEHPDRTLRHVKTDLLRNKHGRQDPEAEIKLEDRVVE